MVVVVAMAVVAMAVVAVACGGSGGSSPTASSADGRQIYAAKCAECHGANLEGTSRGPSHLSRVYEPGAPLGREFPPGHQAGLAPAPLELRPMAPVAGLSDADVNAVIAFVRAQQRERGFID